MKGYLKRGISILVVCSVLLVTGCGKKNTIPKLKESVARVEKTYIAQQGDICDMYSYEGYVVPKMRYVQATCAGMIKDVCFAPGDKVRKGDVIMRLDSTDLLESKEELQAQMQSDKQNYEYQNSICEDMIVQLKLQKMQVQSQNPKMTTKCKQQLQLLDQKIVEQQHDKQYNYNTYQLSAKNCSERIAKIEQKIKDNTITAACTGTLVYYPKGSELGAFVDRKQVVAYVSDDSKHFVQCVGAGIQNSLFESADEKMIQIGDKQFPVKKYEYTAAEKEIANQNEIVLPDVYEFKLANSMKAGDHIVILLKSNEMKNVIYIPRTAVTSDADNNYVYIKSKKDNSTKKVKVKSGGYTHRYIEIKKGLEPGDQVLYSEYEDTWNDNLEKAKNVQSLTIESNSLTQKMSKKYLQPLTVDYLNSGYSYWNGTEAKLIKFCVERGDAVKKGQTVALIDVGIRESDILELQSQVSSLQREQSTAATAFQSQKSALYRKKSLQKTNVEKQIVDYDIKIAQKQYNMQRASNTTQIMQLQKQISKLQSKKNGVAVVANYSGRVMDIASKSDGALVSPGDQLVKIEDRSCSYVAIAGYGKNFVQDCKVSLENEDGKVYQAKVFRSDLNVCEEEANDEAAYARIDQEVDSTMTFVKCSWKNKWADDIILVPNAAVYSRAHLMELEEENQISKQYVYVKDEAGNYNTVDVNAVKLGKQYWIVDGVKLGDTIYYAKSKKEVK